LRKRLLITSAAGGNPLALSGSNACGLTNLSLSGKALLEIGRQKNRKPLVYENGFEALKQVSNRYFLSPAFCVSSTILSRHFSLPIDQASGRGYYQSGQRMVIQQALFLRLLGVKRWHS
jgi:hypothetical protein